MSLVGPIACFAMKAAEFDFLLEDFYGSNGAKFFVALCRFQCISDLYALLLWLLGTRFLGWGQEQWEMHG